MSQERFNFEKERLMPAIHQMMGFSLSSLCEFGMKLAMTRQLSDLKGLVDPAPNGDVDFKLLECLDDPVINVLLKSIDMFHEKMHTYILINGMDWDDAMFDLEANEYAGCIYHHSFISELAGEEYGEILSDIDDLYDSLRFVFYLAARVYTDDQIDADFEELPLDWLFLDEAYDWSMMDLEEKNVRLLYELTEELRQDLNEFCKVAREQ